jgi:CBS domain-containing protein
MTILNLVDDPIAAVSSYASVAEAIKEMLYRHLGAVAILDEAGRVVGIFTERDVLVKFALTGLDPAVTPVCEFMTTPVHTASSAITPGEALTMMLERHFRHLPIVDADGRIQGILSLRDLLQWRADDLSHELDALEQYYSNDSLGG